MFREEEDVFLAMVMRLVENTTFDADKEQLARCASAATLAEENVS